MLGREGMENKSKNVKSGGSASSDSGTDGSTDGSSVCPKDCSAVEALRTKLTGLIENAAKLQNQIKENNETIKNQHKTIENMQKSVQKLVQKSK
jgi:hypothetical protein